MDIDVITLKLLRNKTEAGMLDCRRALAESGGDIDAAEALLKAWGLSGVEKRSCRETHEGRVFVSLGKSDASMVELDCETDFVSGSDGFIALGTTIADHARAGRLESPDARILDLVAGLASVVKENLIIRRITFMEASRGGRIEAYVHGGGRIGVLLESWALPAQALDDPEVAAFIHDLALQVAAFSPAFVDGTSLSAQRLADLKLEIEKEVGEDPGLAAKSQAIRNGAISGKYRKRLIESSLLDHSFVKDDGTTARKALAELAARKGCGLGVSRFSCFKVDGE
jgi:elongation factor Ts